MQARANRSGWDRKCKDWDEAIALAKMVHPHIRAVASLPPRARAGGGSQAAAVRTRNAHAERPLHVPSPRRTPVRAFC